jgi:signal transduction histidine kinase
VSTRTLPTRLVPRSVRGRLVAVYTLAALVLGLVGGVVFTIQLRAGLRASLDAALDARAEPLVDALREPGTPELPDAPETDPPRGSEPRLETITVVYRPDGTVASAAPPSVRASALSPSEVAAARTAPLRLTRMLGGEEVRLLATPVGRSDGQWVVAVGTDQGTAKEAADQVDRGLLIAGPILLVAVAAGAWLLSGAALRPVERLRADAEDLGAHNAAGRLTVPATEDEIAALARTLNALLDRLHRSLARQRDLVADAGHELRTPLAVLRTELELADRPHRSREELADAVSHARGEVDRLSRLADDLLFLARADGGAPLVDRRPTDLTALLGDAARAARAAARVSLDVTAPDALVATVDAAAVRRAVDNLLANALAATPPGGSVTLRAERSDSDVVVSVEDTGPGFPPEFLPVAFERFRRAEPSRSAAYGGAGLGLAIVAEIAAAHGGTVSNANRPDGGARVAIRLPG